MSTWGPGDGGDTDDRDDAARPRWTPSETGGPRFGGAPRQGDDAGATERPGPARTPGQQGGPRYGGPPVDEPHEPSERPGAGWRPSQRGGPRFGGGPAPSGPAGGSPGTSRPGLSGSPDPAPPSGGAPPPGPSTPARFTPPPGGGPSPLATPTRRPPRRSRVQGIVAVVAFVAALATGLALVLPSQARTDPTVLIRDAAATTTGARTAQFRGTATLTLGGRSQQISSYSGASDFDAGTMAFDVQAGGVTAASIRYVDGAEYLAQPFVALPGGARWVRITTADLGTSGQSSAFGSGDPTSGLQLLHGIVGEAQHVDRETLDGVDVTRYRFTLDFTKAFDAIANASDGLGDTQFADNLRQVGSLTDLHHVPGEAWLDGSGRVRRLDYTLDLHQGGEHATEVVRLDFSHFGDQVTVTAPPPSTVVPFSQVPDLFQRLQALSGASATGGATTSS